MVAGLLMKQQISGRLKSSSLRLLSGLSVKILEVSSPLMKYFAPNLSMSLEATMSCGHVRVATWNVESLQNLSSLLSAVTSLL